MLLKVDEFSYDLKFWSKCFVTALKVFLKELFGCLSWMAPTESWWKKTATFFHWTAYAEKITIWRATAEFKRDLQETEYIKLVAPSRKRCRAKVTSLIWRCFAIVRDYTSRRSSVTSVVRILVLQSLALSITFGNHNKSKLFWEKALHGILTRFLWNVGFLL